jgi:hypothetical protein
MAEQTSDIGEQLATIERKPAKERAPEYSRLQATVGEKLNAAETGLKKAEIDVDIAQKEAGTKALREQIGLEEKELEAGRERVSRYELPTFTPSQETLTDYARLGSMVMTLGIMLGKGAKDSGLTAINAMSGLLQGWKQGRKDVYERELKKFDKEFQRIKEIRNSIEKDIQRASQLWPTKRQEAIAAAESAAYKAGSGSIIEYYAKTGQLKKAQDLIESSKKTTDEIVKQQARIDEIKAREEAANKRAAAQRAATIEAARIRADAAAGKMDNKTKAEIRGNLATLGNISDLSRMLPTVPDAASVFGIIAGNVPENLQQLYSSPQAQQAISLLQNVSSQILKLRSGATVTVAEFARQRGFLPQRSDSTEAIQNKLRGLWDAVTNETTGYGLTQKQLTETAGEISQIPEPLAPSYRPTTREDRSLGSRSSQDGWKIEKVNK